jgi:hypothetical protein
MSFVADKLWHCLLYWAYFYCITPLNFSRRFDETIFETYQESFWL